MGAKCGKVIRVRQLLESVILGGAKRILGCYSKTCNEAVRGDMGLETLQGGRDKFKLKLWYKLASMSGILGECLVRTGMLSHIEVGRGKYGVG